MTDERAVGPAGEHPDEELLSAYVDSSLDATERVAVHDHVAACPTCRAELEQLQVVRDVMRTLPFVDPPFGFFERTLRLGPRPSSTGVQRLGITVTAAVIGLVVVLVTVAVVRWRADEVRPAASSLARALESLDRAPGAVRLPRGLPARLGQLSYQGPATVNGRYYEVYGDGELEVGVTWWDAELAGHARDGGSVLPVAVGERDRGWWTERDGARVAVVERGDRVYAVVGPAGVDVLSLAVALPEEQSDPSLGERIQSAGRSLLEAFGLGGS